MYIVKNEQKTNDKKIILYQQLLSLFFAMSSAAGGSKSFRFSSPVTGPLRSSAAPFVGLRGSTAFVSAMFFLLNSVISIAEFFVAAFTFVAPLAFLAAPARVVFFVASVSRCNVHMFIKMIT